MKQPATNRAQAAGHYAPATGAARTGIAAASGVKRRRREGALCAPCVGFADFFGETCVEGGAQAPPDARQPLAVSLEQSDF